jgi:hypothetical protein
VLGAAVLADQRGTTGAAGDDARRRDHSPGDADPAQRAAAQAELPRLLADPG